MNVAQYPKFNAALDPQHPLHLLPTVPKGAKRILDVGCREGHILAAMQISEDCQVFGCDIIREGLEIAKQSVPKATFEYGDAHCLPYDDSSFDFLFARGVVVALDIPRALSEFSRVLSAGGKLWLSLHRWRDCRVIWQDTWRAHPIKTVALGLYTMVNTGMFHYTGKLIHYASGDNRRFMSFQTETRMRKELEKAGFASIVFSHGTYLVVEAAKARDVFAAKKAPQMATHVEQHEEVKQQRALVS